MYIDTHCHLSKKDYPNISDIIKENRENKVSPIIVSACCKDDFEEAIEYAKKYEEVYLTLGFHPEEVNKITESDFQYLKEQLKEQKVIGIGEIGLDYHYDKTKKEEQKKLFRRQLDLAEELHLPVVIHTRDATQDTIEILKEYHISGIIHCFSGSIEVAKIYIKMGFWLGIGGIVTFQNSHLKEVLEKIPLESIVLETDSPYLAPVPFRGTQNSSKNIPIIGKEIAKIKKVSTKVVEKVTTENAKKIFDFPKSK